MIFFDQEISYRRDRRLRIPLEDWEYYRGLDYWEPIEAVCLLKGIPPGLGSNSYDESCWIRKGLTMCARACQMNSLACDYIEMRNEPVYDYQENGFYNFIEDAQNFDIFPSLKVFKPALFLVWASNRGFKIPYELEFEGEWTGDGYNGGNKEPFRFKNQLRNHYDNHLIKQEKKSNIIIDLNDKNLSCELKASLKAWADLYMGKEDISKLKGKCGHIKTIQQWVKENLSKEKFSGKALERIATVVNPDKKGGTPTTPS